MSLDTHNRMAPGLTAPPPLQNAETLAELDRLAEAAMTAFQASERMSDIDTAISTYKQAIAHTPKLDSGQLVVRLSELANACFIRFSFSRRILGVRQSVSYMQAAKNTSVGGETGCSIDLDEALGQTLTELGMSLVRRATSEGKAEDLDQAIRALRQAVDITPPAEPSLLSDRTDALAVAFKRRFQRYGDLEDIHQSIALQLQAPDVNNDSSDSAIRGHSIRLYNLAASLSARYQALGGAEDLVRAIESLRQAVKIVLPTDSNRPTYLLELGGNLNLLFEATRETDVINESIQILQEAVSLSDEDENVNHPPILVTLGEAYVHRFTYLGGSPDDIAEAITLVRRALELTPLDHPSRPKRLPRLGAILLLRFQQLGGTVYLQEAVVCYREAIRLVPEDHPDLPSLYDSLGVILVERCSHIQKSSVLEAIDLSRQAIKLAPDEHPHLASYIYNLASTLNFRYSVFGTEADMEEAATLYQKALSKTPPSAPDYALYQSKVAGSLSARFQRGRDMQDLDQSIQLYKSAVGSANRQGHRRYLMVKDYAAALCVRYAELGTVADLNSVILLLQEITSTMQGTYTEATYCHFKLADAFRMRFEAQGDMEDLHKAVQHYRQAALSPGGKPCDRLTASRGWAMYSEVLDPRGSLGAHAAASEIVALVAGMDRGLERTHDNLANKETYKVGAAAASAALAHGEVEKALEWLEQGRCLVWRKIHELRTPIEELRSKYGDLADDVVRLSGQLEEIHANIAAPTSLCSSSPEARKSFGATWKLPEDLELHRRMKLRQDWESVIQRVREKDGFESFLRPPPIPDTLERLPQTGYTVAFSLDFDRCYAIVMSPGKKRPESLRLTEFSVRAGAETLDRLQSCLRASGVRGGPSDEGDVAHPDEDSDGGRLDDETRAIRKFKRRVEKKSIGSVLRDLWKCVVKPVIEHIQLKPSANPAERARIWWCVSGPLAFLPIHAAGIYASSKSPEWGEALVHYAISSYTPNLSALTNHTHEAALPMASSQSNNGVLLISHSGTPGSSSIPGVTAEASAIRNIAQRGLADPVEVVHLENGSATVENAKNEIASPKFGVIHFACHAKQNHKTPMQSGFRLDDGQLELGDIIGLRRGHPSGEEPPKLAFLSACETGMGTVGLSEEAVHLVAGMLVAGFRGAIGTMWSIPDASAPDVAEKFYQRYLGPGGGDAPYALHCAIEELQEKLGNSDTSLLAWVPFMHFGL